MCVSNLQMHVKCPFYPHFLHWFIWSFFAVIDHLAENCKAWWPIIVSLVNSIGAYSNKPSNYNQKAIETSQRERKDDRVCKREETARNYELPVLNFQRRRNVLLHTSISRPSSNNEMDKKCITVYTHTCVQSGYEKIMLVLKNLLDVISVFFMPPNLTKDLILSLTPNECPSTHMCTYTDHL